MSIPSTCLHMFVGSSESGKSFLLRSFLTSLLLARKVKFGIVFTTTKFNSGYDWLPDRFVYTEFSQEVLHEYLRILVAIKQQHGQLPPSFIVLDDIINSINQSAKWWNEFLATYRHYNITLFVTTQHVNRAMPLLREQASYAYIFRLHTIKAIQATYDSYGQLFPRMKEWQAFLSKHTAKDYTCVVVKKEAPPNITKKYSTYRAPAKRKEVKFEY